MAPSGSARSRVAGVYLDFDGGPRDLSTAKGTRPVNPLAPQSGPRPYSGAADRLVGLPWGLVTFQQALGQVPGAAQPSDRVRQPYKAPAASIGPSNVGRNSNGGLSSGMKRAAPSGGGPPSATKRPMLSSDHRHAQKGSYINFDGVGFSPTHGKSKRDPNVPRANFKQPAGGKGGQQQGNSAGKSRR